MKRKINYQLMTFATLAIILTTLLIGVVFYELFSKQVTSDLENYGKLLVNTEILNHLVEDDYIAGEDDVRVTVIESDGTVRYDNEAAPATMNNHSNRPEFVNAMAYGEGTSIRKSETLDQSTYYYAIRLEDGSVLRVAKEADNIWSMLKSVLPVIFGIIVLLLVVSYIAAHFLTRTLIRPIEQLSKNLEHTQGQEPYDELRPFIDVIRKQHIDIVKNARMRQEFTANVSHELKTPLTSISGYAELIETGMASEEDTICFAQGIHKSANRLLVLINDIIRLSELDSEEKEVVFEDLNLYQAAETCVDMLEINAGKHNVKIKLEGNECHIKGNKQMIEELIYNLCDNAIRYNNENGTVKVSIFPRREHVCLEIEDTGIGIPRESQERIFERFYRVDKSRSKSTGGTGLGLAIVKHIVAKHGATMELESEEGRGTKITVVF